ncbi:TraI [Klebsiella pneumoniae]|nr:TraI [Klebsiella pneumoniae]
MTPVAIRTHSYTRMWVVANVTQHNGEWKTLSSDKVGKTGFIENVYANQIAFGRLYREKLKRAG